MSRIKKVMLIAFIVICIITLGIVSYILINDNLENNSNKQDIEELIDDVFIQDIDTTEEPIIDWNYLKSINKDIIGWIEIEGTEINYPILKDSVNLYYLKHNYLKNYNSNGSIFTLNNKPFEDEETLIYGHNMKNGTMFSLLGNYLNEDYLYSHQNIKIYTSEKNYKGVIFSAYSIGIGTGIGTFEKALERLNIKYDLVGFSEIDKHAIKSYCAIHNVTEDKNYGDISKINENELPDFDIMTWGFPCQDISIAGKLKGIKEGETRSGLYYEGYRILKTKKPKVSIIENVKNLTSKRFKNEFDSILKDLSDLGYNNYWQVLNAKDYGIPQNRERVFIISIRKDIDNGKFIFPEKIQLQLKLKDLLEEVVDNKYYLT